MLNSFYFYHVFLQLHSWWPASPLTVFSHCVSFYSRIASSLSSCWKNKTKQKTSTSSIKSKMWQEKVEEDLPSILTGGFPEDLHLAQVPWWHGLMDFLLVFVRRLERKIQWVRKTTKHIYNLVSWHDCDMFWLRILQSFMVLAEFICKTTTTKLLLRINKWSH